MRIRLCPALALLFAMLPIPAFAQNQPTSTVRTLLAAGRLASVVDMPLYLGLYRVGLPPGLRSVYSGSNAMLYALSGALAIKIGSADQSLAEGTGALLPASQPATLSASGQEPATFVLFVLSPNPNERKPLLDRPAAVEELYWTPEPLPGLKPGPYEFSLTRVALPPGMPANPPHYRSGAALYYILVGAGLFSVEGKTEPRTAGMPHFEPYGLVHQWANPGDTPLVLLQANISQEGIPAVLAK